ncbi:hypothetical protein TIFTF001_053502 [Ficus carica]|uniref:Uncharacterized protein n=1 Tax=Ficus carica TaxID=3494 RepID=A0AA88ECB2_FICCA|nr:hypothetical protein TIFTF001_053502 [Ficus carica]
MPVVGTHWNAWRAGSGEAIDAGEGGQLRPTVCCWPLLRAWKVRKVMPGLAGCVRVADGPESWKIG